MLFPNYRVTRATILDMRHKPIMPSRTDCYSGLQEIQCQMDDPKTIFYNKTCVPASQVCQSFGFQYGNVTHCYDGARVRLLRQLYERVLSSEEYFKYASTYLVISSVFHDHSDYQGSLIAIIWSILTLYVSVFASGFLLSSIFRTGSFFFCTLVERTIFAIINYEGVYRVDHFDWFSC